MFGKALLVALMGLCPSLNQAATEDDYKKVYTNFGAVVPSEIRPSSDRARQFGKNVVVSGSLIAVTSNEVVVDYDRSGQVGTRGRVSIFGADYLRRYSDSGVNFVSSQTNDGFGTSLALWRNTMVVGAPFDAYGGENSGKAYIYHGSNYGSRQAVTAENPEEGDYFGYSVAISHGKNSYSSQVVVVGAYGHDHDKESTSGQGCVFVYALDSSSVWSIVGRLEPQDFEHKDHGGFGYSLSAYGNTVAVGTYSTDKAFVFEMLGHEHECPPEHEQDKEDYPADCLDDDNSRRNLRALQGPPEEEDKKWYTEWKYEHILTVGIEEEHKPEEEKEANSYSFGHTVALYNASGLLTLAVGAPDAVSDNGAHTGRVYVMSIMNRGDVEDGWYPEGYDHHEEDKQREEAEREAERQERENNENNDKRLLQGEGDKNRFRTWNFLQDNFCGDKMGNFWTKEAVFSGSSAYERFGHSIDIGHSTLLIGNNPSTFQAGKAIFYQRSSVSSSSSSSDSPIISGPLYNTQWTFAGALKDTRGMSGDQFGFSVSFEGNIAAVGTVMNDIKEDGTFGQGVTYIYDKVTMINVAPTPSPVADQTFFEQVTDTHTAVGVTFVSSSTIIGVMLVLLCGYAVYRGSGGESSPAELCGLSKGKSAPKQLRLATMDDSGYSPNRGSGGSSQLGSKSAYSGLDTSSSHGLNRLPARPNSQSRSFTPQAQRSFTPKSRAPPPSQQT